MVWVCLIHYVPFCFPQDSLTVLSTRQSGGATIPQQRRKKNKSRKLIPSSWTYWTLCYCFSHDLFLNSSPWVVTENPWRCFSTLWTNTGQERSPSTITTTSCVRWSFGTGECHIWLQATVIKDVLIISVLSFYGSSPGSPHPLCNGRRYFHSGEGGRDLQRESWYAELPSPHAKQKSTKGKVVTFLLSCRKLAVKLWVVLAIKKNPFILIQFWLKIFHGCLSCVSTSNWNFTSRSDGRCLLESCDWICGGFPDGVSHCTGTEVKTQVEALRKGLKDWRRE